MNFWTILTYSDLLLFILVALTVLYLGIFAFTSMFARHSETPKARNQNRFIIFIPSHKSGKSVEMTVNSILGQTYPQRLFDVTVIADHEDEITMFHLAQQPVTLLTPNYAKSSRTKSLQLAINNLPQFKIYDVVIILDAGDVVEPEFLEQMNDAYESAGTKAIQAHKVSLNRDTVSARLSSIFEEINNSIFRRGHISVGLSAAMASSGMVFNFDWFKQQILAAKINWADKELEALLLRHHIYVDYFDKIMVYGEKARQAEEFNRQHRNWILTQWRAILRNLRHLPIAILQKHYDMIDKLLQWILIPRMLMMVIILLMCIIMPFIYFTMAIKWWALFAIVLFVFAMATPNYLVDEKWDSTFFKIPFVLMSSILHKFKWGRKFIEAVNLKH
jgi:cellulose synthase/poly-beta-1,6-N-acetylglucosamine synthase-like glycosyltransferase